MKRTFEEKLQAYEKGELTEEERQAFEKELDTLEQVYEKEAIQNNTSLNKREQNILRKGKWKARIQTTFFIFILILGIPMLTSIATNIYYSWGTPDKSEVMANVIDYTYALTDPYGNLYHSFAQTNLFFGTNVETTKRKQVGDDIFDVGQSNAHFFFSYLRWQEDISYADDNSTSPGFYLPGGDEWQASDWDQLENLPEGTVSSASISFNEFLETEEVFDILESYNLEILWFGVEAGAYRDPDSSEENFISDLSAFGFPATPIWLEEDWQMEERHEVSDWFGTRTVTESSTSPEYEHGDSEVLHEQFLKVLDFLSDHEKLAERTAFGDMPIEDMIQYLEENGIHHYGVVVTGPTKELLALRENEAIYALQLDETQLWNWTDRTE